MSWWVELTNAGPVELFQDGGTQLMGGSTQAELNVTYNYSEVYSIFDFHLHDSLHGKRAGDTVAKMEEIIKKCGTRGFKDYWAPTPGNAAAALLRLVAWAKQYPDGIWEVR